MRISKIASTSALCTALLYTPIVSALLVVLMLVAAAIFLWWFARQSDRVRAHVIRLIGALRGNRP